MNGEVKGEAFVCADGELVVFQQKTIVQKVSESPIYAHAFVVGVRETDGMTYRLLVGMPEAPSNAMAKRYFCNSIPEMDEVAKKMLAPEFIVDTLVWYSDGTPYESPEEAMKAFYEFQREVWIEVFLKYDYDASR